MADEKAYWDDGVAADLEESEEEASEASLLEEGMVDLDKIVEIQDIDAYDGNTIEEKVDTMLASHGVVVIATAYCPFCLDVKDFLSEQMGVRLHVLHIDSVPQGRKVHSYIIKSKTDGYKTVPAVFIQGSFVGGCDDVKAKHSKGELENLLKPYVVSKKTTATTKLETSKLVAVSRGKAQNPPFWFPNVVNNYVIRLVGLQVFALCIVSMVFYKENFARYIAVALLVDFVIRMACGSFLSPLGMVATVVSSPFRPEFKPGPPKQFASVCGILFSMLATIFYFVDFEGHDIVAVVILGMLACAAGLEAFFNFCLGCVFYGFGVQFGLIPNSVYRIYTSSKQEIEDAWDYMFTDSNAPKPEKVDTDPKSPVSLKYKKKTDEWTKDDFHLVRNMQAAYFAMPLSICGLAAAFKISSGSFEKFGGESIIVTPDAWYITFATAAAVIFVLMLSLYLARLIFYPNKCAIEWHCTLRNTGFGLITLNFMIFGFLVFDEINDQTLPSEETRTRKFARALLWIGAVGHSILTIAKFGEWIARRLELEHVHTHWMIFPVGLAVASLCAVTIPMFPLDDLDNSNHWREANALVSRFFYSFAYLMWITLFVVTFFKVVTSHNSDDRRRHGIWIWLAAPCVIGLSDFALCTYENNFSHAVCATDFSNYYFIGMFIFLSFLWATMPWFNFFGQDKFGMGYYIECFAIDALAACAAQFYANNGFRSSRNLMYIGLTLASLANLVAFLHTCAAIIRRRGVFTPEVKWGPLSFMKLTHEAFRGNMDKLRSTLDVVDLNDKSTVSKENLGLFAAHFNQFCIVHTEHAKHEDEVIFKIFNDFFPEHAKVYNDDHAVDHENMLRWNEHANKLLDTGLSEKIRQESLAVLKKELIPFFDHFLEHLRGEEDNLNPIGRKYIPLELQKQMSRDVFNITSAENWEIIIPFVINNLPRHVQRVRYLKVLFWTLPERAQQIGAIVYRNVDAVMWERLRVILPEMIPRKANNWQRYY